MMAARLTYIRIIATLLLAVACRGVSWAQSDPQFTQYYNIPAFYNAGAIGTTDLLRINAGGRLQWMGIDGAPRSFVATADMPWQFGKRRVAAGLVAMQENIGLYNTMSLGLKLAYQFKLWGGRLSTGVGVGFIDQGFKGSQVVLPDEDDYHQGTDDAIPTTDIRGNSLDMSLGLYYTHKYFWLGVSVNHLNDPTVTMDSQSGASGIQADNNFTFTMGRVAYFMAGGNIKVKNTLLEVIPSLMVKTGGRTTMVDITGRLMYNNFLSAGMGYRYDDSVYFLLGAHFKSFTLGYSYDYPTGAISKASSGSHELTLGYSMKLDFSEKNRNKHKSIRIM